LVSAAQHVINVARHAGIEVSAVMATARHGDAGTMMAATATAKMIRHNEGGHGDGGYLYLPVCTTITPKV